MVAWAVALALALTRAVSAGYITVGMSEARQCNTSLVEWYGDDGPYHLLLTPTQFKSHGYNVWIPTIPNGTNSYNLSITQPAGLQYMVTVWGASGIEYAGTTDVLTVQPSTKNDCFMSDEAINKLYTFAFNISNAGGFPPQCSNLSMTWPTSLESNITSARRSLDEGLEPSEDNKVGLTGFNTAPLPLAERDSEDDSESDEASPVDAISPDALDIADSLLDLSGPGIDTSSSNKTSGNTTVPPTMFGIIPLGNSFQIPITYPRTSKFSGLPDEYLSDEASTWTRNGVTHLNWTVSLTKGTRFILVAGIGSAEQWASGGSSEMMTVGQGGFGCFNKPGAKPSVTMSGSSTGALNRPTASSSSAPKEGRKTSVVGIVMACVFSALGTLALITCLWCGCRVRRSRRAATKKGLPKPSIVSLATFGRLDKKSKHRYVPGNRDAAETQLDLINDSASERPASTWSRRPAPTSPSNSRPGTEYLGSPVDATPDQYGYVYDLPFANVPYGHPPRTSSAEDSYPYGYTHVSSPLNSPTRGPSSQQSQSQDIARTASAERFAGRDDFLGRQTSLDGLVAYPTMAHSPSPPPLPEARRGPLVLHDPSSLNDEGDITDLKRDTLAILPRSPVASGSRPRRRRTDDDGAILVHRDAGRVAAGPRRGGGPVVELPPRYEELSWDDEDLPPPRRASSVPAPSVSPRPASYAGTSSPLSESPRASPMPLDSPRPMESPRASPIASPYLQATYPPTASPSPRPVGSSPYLPPMRLSYSDAGSTRSAISPIATLPPGAAPPRAPPSPLDSPRRSPLDSPRRSPLDSPVPSRHSMA